nr:uncharacterized protein LOC118971780 [Manis javanica]
MAAPYQGEDRLRGTGGSAPSSGARSGAAATCPQQPLRRWRRACPFPGSLTAEPPPRFPAASESPGSGRKRRRRERAGWRGDHRGGVTRAGVTRGWAARAPGPCSPAAEPRQWPLLCALRCAQTAPSCRPRSAPSRRPTWPRGPTLGKRRPWQGTAAAWAVWPGWNTASKGSQRPLNTCHVPGTVCSPLDPLKPLHCCPIEGKLRLKVTGLREAGWDLLCTKPLLPTQGSGRGPSCLGLGEKGPRCFSQKAMWLPCYQMEKGKMQKLRCGELSDLSRRTQFIWQSWTSSPEKESVGVSAARAGGDVWDPRKEVACLR